MQLAYYVTAEGTEDRQHSRVSLTEEADTRAAGIVQTRATHLYRVVKVPG